MNEAADAAREARGETPNAFGELDAHSARVGATTAFAESFARDLGGRITERSETIGGVTTLYAYHYDAAGRLDEVQQNGAVSATYVDDANGSRLSITTPGGSVAGSYDAHAQDRLTSYGTKSYAYTRAGDLATKTDTATLENTAYGYDALGNLRSVALPTRARRARWPADRYSSDHRKRFIVSPAASVARDKRETSRRLSIPASEREFWRKRTGIEPAGAVSPRLPPDLKSGAGTSATNASASHSSWNFARPSRMTATRARKMRMSAPASHASA